MVFQRCARVAAPTLRFTLLGRRATNGKSNVVARLKRGAYSRTTISRVRLAARISPRTLRDASLLPHVPFVVDGSPPRPYLSLPLVLAVRAPPARTLPPRTYRSEDISDIILERPHQMQIVVLDAII